MPSLRRSDISGTTRVAGLIGYPARYSLSPVLHNAAYKEMGLDIVYVVFPVAAESLSVAIDAVRYLDVLGLSVTIPHKENVISFLDELSPEASRLNAVNTIVSHDTRIAGHNTDGVGFVRSLSIDSEFDPVGKRCAVIGAGGAARAIIAALVDARVSEVIVVNRTRASAEAAAAIAGAVARVGDVDDVKAADLVVNATSVGMAGSATAGQIPVDVSFLQPGQVVADIVFHPLKTPFLAAAEDAGARATNGLGMLVHQASLQIELWTGQEAPVGVMRAAAMAVL